MWLSKHGIHEIILNLIWYYYRLIWDIDIGRCFSKVLCSHWWCQLHELWTIANTAPFSCSFPESTEQISYLSITPCLTCYLHYPHILLHYSYHPDARGYHSACTLLITSPVLFTSSLKMNDLRYLNFSHFHFLQSSTSHPSTCLSLIHTHLVSSLSTGSPSFQARL